MTTLLEINRPSIKDSQNPDKASLNRLLSSIADLEPMIAALVPEIEQGRRLPAKLVCALKSARIYSMQVPRAYGGLGLAAPSAFQAVSALARLDGSVGWNAMIGSVASLMPFLARQAFCEEVFRDGEDHVIAASGQPAGVAERVPGGWRVNGSWPFVSGCQNAEWIGGSCIMMEGNSPIAASKGSGPMIRLCLLPAEQWEVKDTWHTFGLKGTGSHDVALTDAFAPDSSFIEFPFGDSFAPDPIFSKLPEILMLGHGALAIGIAEGAIADLVKVARAGVKQMFMTTPLAETERFKEGLARLDIELKAARALFEAEVTRVWQNTERPEAKDMSRVADQIQTVIWITSTCVRVAEGCFELAGSRAVYESSSLQRRIRDLRVASTHMAVHPRRYVASGDAVFTRLSSEHGLNTTGIVGRPKKTAGAAQPAA